MKEPLFSQLTHNLTLHIAIQHQLSVDFGGNLTADQHSELKIKINEMIDLLKVKNA